MTTQGSGLRTRQLTIGFRQAGWRKLEAAARREATTPEGLISRACTQFEADLRSQAPISRAPHFKLATGLNKTIGLDLSAEAWDELEREAGEQRIALERLVEHAVTLYLDDLDGRSWPAPFAAGSF